MERLNEVFIDTFRGIRCVELLHGDICDLDEPTDVLVVSVFASSYLPVRGTVVAALLERHGVSLEHLAQHPQIDLIEPLGCWISGPLSGVPFRRVLCVLGNSSRMPPQGEMERLETRIHDMFKAVAVLEAWDGGCRSLAMPLLGAGSQGLDPAKAAAAIVRAAQTVLTQSLSLSRVRIVERDWDKARLLGDTLDAMLGRVRIVLGSSSLADQARRLVLQRIERLDDLDDEADGLMTDLARILTPDLTFGQLGAWCRHFCEYIVGELSGSRTGGEREASLSARIQVLDMPAWEKAFLHVLRSAGNQASHYNKAIRPPDGNDMVLVLLAVHQLIGHWRRSAE